MSLRCYRLPGVQRATSVWEAPFFLNKKENLKGTEGTAKSSKERYQGRWITLHNPDSCFRRKGFCSPLLSMMADIIGGRRDVELVAGCVDEGIDGYRAPSMEFARELADSLSLRFETLSYEEMGYGKMDEVVKLMPAMGQSHVEAKGLMPCSYCGVFRRQGLNALAERVGADVMALGHNLDDMAQSILMNLKRVRLKGQSGWLHIPIPRFMDWFLGLSHFDGYLSKRSMLMPCSRDSPFTMETVLMPPVLCVSRVGQLLLI